MPDFKTLPPVVQQRIQIEHAQDLVPGDCWLWTGTLIWNGYGIIRIANVQSLAHRLTYTTLVGPIPEGLNLDHLCRVRKCCNPSHLEPVTSRINSLRSPRCTKTHCIHGHEFTAENTYWHFRGTPEPRSRHCRTCLRDCRRRYAEKKKRRMVA